MLRMLIPGILNMLDDCLLLCEKILFVLDFTETGYIFKGFTFIIVPHITDQITPKKETEVKYKLSDLETTN